jgi:hypothetical protein
MAVGLRFGPDRVNVGAKRWSRTNSRVPSALTRAY